MSAADTRSLFHPYEYRWESDAKTLWTKLTLRRVGVNDELCIRVVYLMFL